MAENGNDSGLGALLLGVGVGVALGLLFAPQSGEETREIIVDRAKDGVVYAADVIEDLKMQVEAGLTNAGEAIEQLKERAEDTVADARERLQEAVRIGQDAYRNELQQRHCSSGRRSWNRFTRRGVVTVRHLQAPTPFCKFPPS
jgi:gas vesicle protein